MLRHKLTYALTALSLFSAGYVAANEEYDSGYYYDECYDWNDCGSKIIFSADLLVWRPCMDGIAVAYKENDRGFMGPVFVGGNLASLNAQTETEKFDPNFDAGVRLSAAYQPGPACCWDATLRWTYFSADNSEKATSLAKSPDGTTSSSGIFLAPFRSHSVFEGRDIFDLILTTDPQLQLESIDNVKGKWNLDLSVIDLELGRRFWVGSCFSLRPHVDVRFVAIDQDLKIATDGTLVDEPAEPEATADFTLVESFKNEFNGIGPRVGVDSEWDIGCGAGVYGGFAFSLMYGDREASLRQVATRSNGSTIMLDTQDPGIVRVQTFNKHCIRPIADLDVGIYYTTCFGQGRYNVVTKLGWEQHYYFNQGVADAAAGYTLRAKEENSALSTQGVRVSASITF